LPLTTDNREIVTTDTTLWQMALDADGHSVGVTVVHFHHLHVHFVEDWVFVEHA